MLFPGALGLGLTYMSERKAVLGLAVSRPLPPPRTHRHLASPRFMPHWALLSPPFRRGRMMLLEVELLAQELRWKELGWDLNSGLGLLSKRLPSCAPCASLESGTSTRHLVNSSWASEN